jgi:hypothetical protein
MIIKKCLRCKTKMSLTANQSCRKYCLDCSIEIKKEKNALQWEKLKAEGKSSRTQKVLPFPKANKLAWGNI